MSKTLSGDAADLPAAATATYDVQYTYPGQPAPQTLTISGDGALSAPVSLPAGTVVTVSEPTKPTVPGLLPWAAATFSGTGVTDHGDGTASFTVGAAGSVALTVTNTAALAPGGFTVTKMLAGDAATAAAAESFTVQYSYGTPAVTAPLTLTPGTPSEAVSLPAGTVVTLSEIDLPMVDTLQDWATPVWTGEGMTDNGDGTATFTVGAAEVLSFTVTNEADHADGSFSLTKALTGAAATAAAGETFSVSYSYGDPVQTATVELTVGEESAAIMVPAGTEVTVVEVDLPAVAGLQAWAMPVWSGAGITDNGDGTATFTVGAAEDLTFTVTNTAAAVLVVPPAPKPVPVLQVLPVAVPPAAARPVVPLADSGAVVKSGKSGLAHTGNSVGADAVLAGMLLLLVGGGLLLLVRRGQSNRR